MEVHDKGVSNGLIWMDELTLAMEITEVAPTARTRFKLQETSNDRYRYFIMNSILALQTLDDWHVLVE